MEGEDLRQKILDEATELFASHGYRGISMREIAEKAGLSKAGLYYHFRDKEDLFMSILVQALEASEVMVENSRNAGKSARERLTHFVEGNLNLSIRDRAIVRLASQDMVHISRDARVKFMSTYHSRFVERIERIIKEGQDAGEIRPLSPSFAAITLLAFCLPFLCHDTDIALPLPDLPPPAQLARDIVASFFDGVAQRS